MFHSDPRALVRGLSRRRYNKYRAYFRIVTGYKPPSETDGLTVTQEGFQPESDAVIVG